jgi:hypothetical protein
VEVLKWREIDRPNSNFEVKRAPLGLAAIKQGNTTATGYQPLAPKNRSEAAFS